MVTKKHAGFTILELSVAVAIVLLLVAVAVASFMDHMTQKSRRHAQLALMDSASWLQQQHKEGTPFSSAVLQDTQVPREGSAEYRIQFAATAVEAVSPKAVFPATGTDAFTLMAVPVEDDDCGSLLIDQAGRKGITGSAELSQCWR